MIRIVRYETRFQPEIDQMMQVIQSEFSEVITTSHSTVISQVYLQPDQKFWVALHDKEVAGTAGVKLFGERAEVKRMFVHPRFRGPEFKTASLLLQQTIAFAKEKNCTELYLGTMTQFKGAQRFYEKSGLTKIEMDELPRDYKLNPMDSVFYKLKL